MGQQYGGGQPRTGREPIGTGGVEPSFHGAKGDSRYPSTRVLRNAAAVVVDSLLLVGLGASILLTFALTAGAGRDMTAAMIGCWSAIVVVLVVNKVVLQVWVSASLGRLLFGLVVIRGADGGEPGLRDLYQGFRRHKRYQLPDVLAGAPDVVVVRRRDRDRQVSVARHSTGFVEY